VWTQDSSNLDWIGMACQKESGSIWFPSKHHLSDEPDSMRISFSVPSPYVAVSNGTLVSVTKDYENNEYNVFEWLVKNPINNYNVTFNIANYAHFEDVFMGDAGILQLDYYVLPDHLYLAKQHFKQVKPMLKVFEHIFGPYPFYDDGYKLVETSYLGMEHQSCISYGNKFMKGYLGSFPANIDFDFIIIHETAHEWWGNSVSMENERDMWIHESFATYAEALYVEKIYGYNDMLTYLTYQKDKILNKEPIVNDKHSTTDMYYKGSWILHTLRTVLNNDVIWMDVLKGLQLNFRHQIVNTIDVIEYIEQEYKYNLDAFCKQYFYSHKLPVFEYFFTEEHNIVLLNFKWNSVSPDFDMPLLVKINQHDTYTWIYPNKEWKTVELIGINIADFKVADELLLLDKRLVK
jgi:aminopeptidase N